MGPSLNVDVGFPYSLDIFTGFKHEITIGKVWDKCFPKKEEVTMETLKMYAKKDEIVCIRSSTGLSAVNSQGRCAAAIPTGIPTAMHRTVAKTTRARVSMVCSQ